MDLSWLNLISPVLRPATKGYSHTGHRDATPSYVQPKRIIYDHELILYQGSTFIVQTENEQITLEPDSFIILSPALLHSEFNIGERTGHRYWCHFDWVWQPDYERTPVMSVMPDRPHFHLCRPAPDYVPEGIFRGKLDNSDAIFGIAENLCDMARGGSESGRRNGRGILLQLLTKLLETEAAALNNQRRHEDSLAIQIRQRLDNAVVGRKSLTPDVTLLLQDLPYSYEHMCRVFRNTYGIPPTKYIRARQISLAEFLLRNTEMQIAEIAYRLGFNTPAYFTKVFRRQTGQTPSNFR